MIIVCHQCSSRLQIDESKFPSRTFTVRCPKCNTEVTSSASATSAATEQSAVSAGGAIAAGNPRVTHPKPAPLFELETAPQTRVIFMSGRDDPSVRGTALEAGAFGFLSKPFDDEVFLQLVRKAVTS